MILRHQQDQEPDPEPDQHPEPQAQQQHTELVQMMPVISLQQKIRMSLMVQIHPAHQPQARKIQALLISESIMEGYTAISV